MSTKNNSWSRREFIQKSAAAGAALSFSPFYAVSRTAEAQSHNKNRVTVAHGVGVYSMNPYAVTTSPIQGVWGSVMETLIDFDYDKREYSGVLAESWTVKGNKLHFTVRKGDSFS